MKHSTCVLIDLKQILGTVKTIIQGRLNERRSGHDGIPGGAVELKGEDDVISAADLTDEATLGAQVTVEHVVGGGLAQCHQVGCVFALRYLEHKHTHY